MSAIRVATLTVIAMLAFAANSVLCRLALKATEIDAASFTTLRIVSGAVMLVFLAQLAHTRRAGHAPDPGKSESPGRGSWWSAGSLFVYAATFSYAYVSLPTATGALLLFGAVQATMIAWGLWRGERLGGWQWLGLLLAGGGLVVLFLPGLARPPLFGALLMLIAGVTWGVYSLRGQVPGSALRISTGNFLRAAPMSIALSVLALNTLSLDAAGVLYALLSGALASGLGHFLWYTVLPHLTATNAATIQLSVPVIAAAGGIVLLGEPLGPRLALVSVAVLGGIALVIRSRPPASAPGAAAPR